MNQRDGFGGGFIVGTIVGGVVGGVIGSILASQTAKELAADVESGRNTSSSDANNSKRKRRQLIKAFSSEQSIEATRRSLEDKIAQLNETIDEVRLTLGEVNGQPQVNTERSLREDLTR